MVQAGSAFSVQVVQNTTFIAGTTTALGVKVVKIVYGSTTVEGTIISGSLALKVNGQTVTSQGLSSTQILRIGNVGLNRGKNCKDTVILSFNDVFGTQTRSVRVRMTKSWLGTAMNVIVRVRYFFSTVYSSFIITL